MCLDIVLFKVGMTYITELATGTSAMCVKHCHHCCFPVVEYFLTDWTELKTGHLDVDRDSNLGSNIPTFMVLYISNLYSYKYSTISTFYTNAVS